VRSPIDALVSVRLISYVITCDLRCEWSRSTRVATDELPVEAVSATAKETT
jgi:hypothetical protein